MKKVMRSILALISISLFAIVANAHEDVGLNVGEDGVLSGLPDEYSPSSVNLKDRVVSVRGSRITIPNCISQNLTDDFTFTVSSSWYHDFSLLPPYINLNIVPADSDATYRLVFSLDDLSLLEFATVEVIKEGDYQTWQQKSVDLDQSCLDDLRNSYVRD